ncbi:MAG: hypothetical protein HY424_01670 [Candidatus Levybacteria bacterium]|nr:hypothetical protein [Candidatus Levybacteria bacterium]
MSTDINLLLRKDEESLRRQKRLKIFNFIAVFFLIELGVISLILFLLIQVNSFSSTKEKDDLLRRMSQLQEKRVKLFVLGNRIDGIQEILDKRKDLSKITSTILAKTPAKLSIEEFEIDNKIIVITANSSSLFPIGELINSLSDMAHKKEIISSLTLNSLVFDEIKNSYQVSVKSNL